MKALLLTVIVTEDTTLANLTSDSGQDLHTTCTSARAERVVKNAISATAASGIRSGFCYCVSPRLASWEPFVSDNVNALGGYILSTFEELAKASPLADGRITIGFAFDGFPFLPQETLNMLMDQLRKLSIPFITFHYCTGPLRMSGQSIPKAIDSLGILYDRWVDAHSSNMTREDGELYRKHKMHISTMSSTELQATRGFPVPPFDESLDVANICSFGVDCHRVTSSFIPAEARLALQSNAEPVLLRKCSTSADKEEKKFPGAKRNTLFGQVTVQSAFNQMTIQAARAAKMVDKIGSIAVGKRADLVLFDANSPSMVCGCDQDPISAILSNSSPSDVHTVIIDGIIRKRDVILPSILLDSRGAEIAGKQEISWNDIANNLLKTREELQMKINNVDFAVAEKGVTQVYGIKETDILNHL